MPTSVSTYNANDPYEQLIAQMVAIERQPQFALRAKQGEQKVFKGVLSDFDSTLSALDSALDALSDRFTNPFTARKATVPEGAGFAVAVTDEAPAGSHVLTVERLASTDTRVSKQLAAAGTDLRAFFDANGEQAFEVEVFSPTDDEPERRVSVAVTVDPAGGTDDAILDEVRTAINDAMSAAVRDGDLSAADVASASVVNETAATSRLSLRSGGTGYQSRLGFTDSADGLLGLLEVDGTTLANSSGTNGGPLADVGTGDADSALNAKFDLDGLTLYRSQNEVDDAVDGMTLTLSSVGEETAFSVDTDEKAVAGDVKDFIKKYNDVLGFIARKSKIDPEAGTRGDFAGDSSIRGLRFGMRTDLLQPVTDQPEGIGRLTDLGIEINDDGTLKLADEDALTAAARRDPDAVQNLFADEDDGLATRLAERLDAFLGTDGILSSRKKSVDARIDRLDDRIERWDTRLAKREDALRQQYARFQETIAVLQGQSASINSFFYGFGY
jgi:flagellar hook-associated protein 2